MSDIHAVIAALEKATGPDRELDAAIAVAIFGGEIVWKTANYTMETYPARRYASANHVGGFCNDHVPLYSASIDAALTLCPDQRGPYSAWNWAVRYVQNAATPALAICIAALKARP